MIWELKNEVELVMPNAEFCAAVRNLRRQYATQESSSGNFYGDLVEGTIEYYGGDGKRYVVAAKSKSLLEWSVKVKVYGRPDPPPDLGSIL